LAPKNIRNSGKWIFFPKKNRWPAIAKAGGLSRPQEREEGNKAPPTAAAGPAMRRQGSPSGGGGARVGGEQPSLGSRHLVGFGELGFGVWSGGGKKNIPRSQTTRNRTTTAQ